MNIQSPPNLTAPQNKNFFRLQWAALSANVVTVFWAGYLFLKTLHWLPGLFTVSQALISTFCGANFLNAYRASQYQLPSASADLKNKPSVAVLLTAVNEPAKIVKKSLLALNGIDYEAKSIFLLDDSAPGSPSSAAYKQVISTLADEGIDVIHIRRKDAAEAFHGGFKAGNLNYFLTRHGSDYKYFASFDADFRPAPTFLKATVPIMESPHGSRTAILQTAQQFEYDKGNPVVKAAWVGNTAMGDVHGKGKDINKTLFWYGSAAIVRTEALFEAAAKRGIPSELVRMDTLAEDYDTSVGITREGDTEWEIHYLDKYLSIGIQPETLLRYFKQQRRWVLGSAQVINKRLLPQLPKLIRAKDYERSFVTIADTLYRISPLQSFLFASAALGFSLIPTRGNVIEILISSAMATSMVLINWYVYFYRGMKRGCKFRDVLRNIDLATLSAPVFLEAAMRSMFSKKAAFETTNVANTGHERIPLKWLLPNLAILGASIGALFYTIADTIADAMSMIQISLTLLICKTLWLLNNIRSYSRIAEFNDGWEETFSDLWEGIKASAKNTANYPLVLQLKHKLGQWILGFSNFF